ncbi:protein FAM135B isoform X1 [Ascaphus truei]|uniref:protein FAM135B isoform X1 n=2 Tax=Ascaphus truei TaxID=8439 RepID=UPI003F5A802E
MSEVQGTVEFSVELHKFHNVDLFQRGYYHVRAALKISARIPHRLTATLIAKTDDPGPYSASVYDNTVYSQIFQILYRNEDIVINDLMTFKVHLLLDGERVEDALSEVDFQLKLDLHFTAIEQQLKDISAVPLISSRTLGLHFHPRRGLHHHVPVMFDYFHLSVISVTVHASLVALHQPLLSFARPVKGSWLGKSSQETGSDQSSVSLENLVFGAAYCKQPSSEESCYVTSEKCIQHAYKWHKDLCLLLLSAYSGLCSYYASILKEIPNLPQTEIEKLAIEDTLSQLCNQLQMLNSPELITEQISKDVAWLCSQLLVLWSQFLETATFQSDVTTYLMQEHHTLRVRRFSEAFFYTEHEKPTVLTFQENLIQSHSNMSTEVRNSEYLTSMPPLPVECIDIDGDWTSLPIIFEDRYVESPRKDFHMDNPILKTMNGKDEYDSNKEIALQNIDFSHDSQFIQTTTVHKNASFEKPSMCMEMKDDTNLNISPQKYITHQVETKTEEPENITGIARECIPLTEKPSSNIELSVLTEHKKVVNMPGNDQEAKMSSGVTYIEVKPSSNEQYMEEPALVVSVSFGKQVSMSYTKNETLQSGGELLNNKNNNTAFENIALHDLDSMKNEATPECRTLHQSMHILSRSNSTELISKPSKDMLMVKLFPKEKQNNKRGDISLCSGIIKRSASVISDSGIESEPSSVAWCDVRNRTVDVPSDKELLQQLVRRHRNSLEGGHTESNTSLPSEIQASLTSINSLPFEDEERETELLKLTKSVSAPQISSPEESVDDITLAPKDVNAMSGNMKIYIQEHIENNDIEDTAESCQNETNTYDSNVAITTGDDPCIIDPNITSESPFVGIQVQSVDSKSDNLLKSYSLAGQVGSEADDVQIIHTHTILCSAGIQDADSISKCSRNVAKILNSTSLSIEPFLDMDMAAKDTNISAISPTNEIFEEFQVLHEIELGDDATKGQSFDSYSNLYHSIYGTDKKDTIIRNECVSVVPETNSSTCNSTVLALERRKGIEMVNLSVSCTATCLPFSSIQKDTPVIPGFSSKQVLFPITRQPLGSFGVTSCNSNIDDEINERMLSFLQAKEKFRKQLMFEGFLYSDLSTLASDMPYFPPEEEEEYFEDGIHLVICVHGLDGNSADLRLVKTFLELGLPGANLDFLMSEKNQTDTFADFDAMTDRLLDEIIQHIQLYNLSIARISFIGHSLGNVIIRSVLTRPRFRYYLNKLHTFLSLSGPHLGTLYNNSTLVSTGLWLMQKLKKSGSLLQLSFRDNADLRKSFLYQLSLKPGLQYFKNVVLVASPQDRYVPFHSARIEMCKNALKDKHTGPVYTEMINNLLQPVTEAKDCTLIRHNVFHALPNTANTLIGRAAHIAVLDSELFLEKFFLVAGLSYFK